MLGLPLRIVNHLRLELAQTPGRYPGMVSHVQNGWIFVIHQVLHLSSQAQSPEQ